MVDWSWDPLFLHSALRHLVHSVFHVSLQILIVHSTLAGLVLGMNILMLEFMSVHTLFVIYKVLLLKTVLLTWISSYIALYLLWTVLH